jgi:hypothetical protein
VLWRIHFESDLPNAVFYVWLDGRLFGSTALAFMDVPVGINQIAQVDVFDNPATVPAAVYPATVTLVWEVGEEVAMSRVEQFVTDAWVVRGQIPATGSGMGRWESAPLADGATHLFRVVTVDGTGRGTPVPRDFSGVMCRWPDAPSAAVSVDEGEFVIA